MYCENLLLKCSCVDFQGREMASICSESTQAEELIPDHEGGKKKTRKKKKPGKKYCEKFLLLKNSCSFWTSLLSLYQKISTKILNPSKSTLF